MADSVPAATRTLARNTNLARLCTEAEELLESFKAGDSVVVAEVESLESIPEPKLFALDDAQRVLARAYGFASWAKLKVLAEQNSVDAFLSAAKSGDIENVRAMLSDDSELVKAVGGTSGEETALHAAVLNRDVGMTRVLMEADADARRGFWPYRSATTAIRLALDRDYHEIAAIIREAENQRQRRQGAAGATISPKAEDLAAAIRAGSEDAAIALLSNDVGLISAFDNQGATPLHLAASKHNPRLVEWLVERGASVHAKNPYAKRPMTMQASACLGETPLDYAAMLAGWSSHSRYYGWTANNERFPYLENVRVAPERFYETVDILRTHGAELTPRAAVALGDAPAVQRMHQEGRLGVSIHPLRGGLLAVAARVDRVDMIRLLLDLGFHPDEPAHCSEDQICSWGFPLWFAALCGRHEIAELLLERGADVNAIVFASGDPLGQATATRDEAMRTLLLQHGARLTVEKLPDDGGKTARAILKGEITAHSLNVVEPSRAEVIECLLRSTLGDDSELNRMCLAQVQRPPDDPWWAALLHTTSVNGLQSLLQHGIHPDVAVEGEPTALHHIASDLINANGHMPDARRVIHAELLLDAGASLARRENLLQSTPLGWACRWGRVGLVELFLDRGAVVDEMDAEPWATPIAWAQKGGHDEVLELLRSRSSS